MIKDTLQKIARISHILCLLLLVSCTFSCKGEENKPDSPYIVPKPDTLFTYTNPLSNISQIGDPYVLRSGGKYYMYATSSGNGFKVWESTNMIDWTEKGLAFDKNLEANKWGKGNFWAPEVKCFNGMFYMSYSAIGPNDIMKIRIARSDNPLGPFLNWSEPFCNNDTYSYIDGDLYIDGQDVYLFYVRDCSVNVIDGKHVSQIYVSKVKSDLTALEGPSSLILTPDQSWEGIQGDWMWNEGPFVLKNNNKLYLFYSANVYSSADYSVGVAVADSPMGSWKKYPGNPVLRKDMSQKISGPGHCMVTYSPDSTEMFMVYHTHTFSDKPSGNRNMCIDRLIFENDIPKVLGPTRTPQTLPSGVKFRVKN